MSGRTRGAAMGFVVAGAFTAVGSLLTSIRGSDNAVEGLLTSGGPVIVTGVVSGFLFGGRAVKAQAWTRRVKDSLAMAFVATAIGDFLVGFGMGVSRGEADINVPERILAGLQSGLVLWPFGLIFFGLIAVPITWAAALAWSMGMERFAADPG